MKKYSLMQSWRWVRLMPMLLLGLMVFLPLEAFAGGGGGGGGGAPTVCGAPTLSPTTPTCTNHPFFDVNSPCYFGNTLTGVLTKIVDRIKLAVYVASAAIFNAITLDFGFNVIVGASMALMIAFFGVAFMFGFVQLTLGQAMIRLIKIGLLVWVMMPLKASKICDNF